MTMIDSISSSVQSIKIEPYLLVDEVSLNEFYIGTSKSFSDQTKSNWRIKKIWKDGNVWMFGYPTGSQDFSFAWSDRAGYTYK